jgi:hypothetical protein
MRAGSDLGSDVYRHLSRSRSCGDSRRNFSDETESNDVGDSLYQAGQELGGGMDDATFLKQCGIEVDVRWLAEIASQNEPTEVFNYATSLFRIADMLSGVPSSLESQLKLNLR